MLILMIILSVLMIMGGISCIVTPIAAFTTLGWLAGISILMVGISAVVRYAAGHEERNIWNLLGGICEFLFGGFLIANNYAQIATSFVLAYVASFFLLIYGIFKIIASLKLKKINQELPDEMRSATWLAVMIAGALSALTGIVCIVQPIVSAISIGWLMGFYVLVSGAETLLVAIHGLRRK